jgi:DNA-binding Lrp family transcriptional regulator
MTSTPPAVGHNNGPAVDWRDYGGFIVEARDSRDHPIIGYGRPVKPADPSRGSYSCNEAWRDLLHECRYQDGYVMNGGQKMLIRRGELIGAVSWLAHRWNWTPKTVRVFLDKLEADGMIARFRADGTERYKGNRNGNQANVLKVCNYEKFNSAPQEEQQSEGQSRGNRGAIEGPHNKEEQRNKGTILDGIARENADEIARQAYLAGLANKGGATAKSARASQRTRGELDGSRGITFTEDGEVIVVNGVRTKLLEAFPKLDIDAVCDRAAPDIAKLSYPRFADAMAALRKWARILSSNPSTASTKQRDSEDDRFNRLMKNI